MFSVGSGTTKGPEAKRPQPNGAGKQGGNAPGSSSPPSRRKRRSGVRVPLWFTLPALIAYAATVLYPAAQGSVIAFSDWDGISPTFGLVGWANFERLFDDPLAISAIVNTLILAAAVMVLQNVFGLILALALNSAVKTRNALRVIFFAPMVLTPLVAGYIWSYMLSPYGGINTALRAIGQDNLTQDWLGDPRFALGCIVVAIIWQFSGYSMVIFLAGLQAIPDELIEASVVDGAGPVRRLFSVILPLLNGAIVINLLITLIGGLGQFDQVWAMTQGGPGQATETISTVIYKTGFQLGDFPYGTSMALTLTLFVATAAIIQYRLTSKQVTA